MHCNICGGTAFSDMPGRPLARCASCGGLERARVAALHIQHILKLQPGAQILHFAPERGISAMLRKIGGGNYRACDIDPAKYPGLGAEPFDLCRDVFGLPQGHYDLILHNHVMEHIECNYTMVLLALARALSPEGVMLFSLPIVDGPFRDELIAGDVAAKVAHFGPMIHVRQMGRDFLQQTLGMIFDLPERYDLLAHFTEAQLVEANIPARHWGKYTGASVMKVTRANLRVGRAG